MNRCVRLVFVAIGMACVALGAQAQERPKLDCNEGGVTRRYGGSDWVAHSCSDGKTVVLVAATGSKAAPFMFVLLPHDGAYDVSGDGTGDKGLTDAAYADLRKLGPAQIGKLEADAAKAAAGH